MGNKVCHQSVFEDNFVLGEEYDKESEDGNKFETKTKTRKKYEDTFFKTLQKNIENDSKEDIVDQIDKIPEEKIEAINVKVQELYNEETLLHLIVKHVDTKNLPSVTKLLKKNATLLLTSKKSVEFKGQTALHIAITQGNFKVVKYLLEFAKVHNMTEDLLKISASGSFFKNTVMMGGLPLSVAALAMKENNSDSKEIIDALIENDAQNHATNEDGDTVFHSLIKYGDTYPDEIFHVKSAFKYLQQELGCLIIRKFLFCQNKDGFTPLQLSAKLGVGEIFECIIDVPQVYRFQNTQDGLFDIRVYDVTEFDRLIKYIDVNDSPNWNPSELTVLERIFNSDCTHKEAFHILNLKLVKFILEKKWKAYYYPLLIWLVFHLLFISIATQATVRKSRVLVCSIENQNNCDLQGDFYLSGIVYLLVGLIYFVFSSLVFHKLVMRLRLGDCGLIWHNLDYIICLIIVSIGSIIESIFIFLRFHADYHLVCIMLCGWYFMLYFSPFEKNCVSFTYMLKAGLAKDFLPFVLTFIFLLLSFTTIMHMLFHGTDDDPEEFDTFRDSLFTMFKLGVALDDIGVLSQSRIPWLAYTMFVLFAILSFIHILNALIAIMSQTFSDVHQQKNSYLQYQRLCMIEMFEDIIITPYLAKILPWIKKAKHWTRKKTGNEKPRYLTTVHSLEKSYYSKDEEDGRKKTSNDDLRKIINLIQTSYNLYESQIEHNEKEVAFIQTLGKCDKSSQIPHLKNTST